MHERDKLRVLIPHWITHNDEHKKEFASYAEHAEEAQPDIEKASEAMEQVNQYLESALIKLGGPLEIPHIHGGSHHEHTS